MHSTSNTRTEADSNAHPAAPPAPQHEELPPNAAISADDANRALRQYLLTEQESRELESAAYDEHESSHQSIDASGETDEDDDGDDGDDGDTESLSRGHTRIRRRLATENESETASLVDPLRLPSGSITYDLYKWHQNHGSECYAAEIDYENRDSSQAAPHHLPPPQQKGENRVSRGRRARIKSLSAVEMTTGQSEPEWNLPLSHTQINAPGGFRRQYLHQRAEDEGRQANILTASFVDFLALYGHFAGEDFPSDEDDDHDDDNEGEREAIAAQQKPKARRAYPSSSGQSQKRYVRAQLGAASEHLVTRKKKQRASLKRPLPAEQVAGERTALLPRKRRVQSAVGSRPDVGSGSSGSRKASTRKTFFLLIKSFIGSGVLFLPRA
ncbi:hypothetical protein GGI12_005591, partial [Dipsacomyces acuminosporus]